MVEVILGSSSKQRKIIFTQWFLHFSVRQPNVQEVTLQDIPSSGSLLKDASVLTANNASRKAEAIQASPYSHALIIGCDTLIASPFRIYGKPENRQSAFQMLSSLSGKTHFAISSVCAIETINPEGTEIPKEIRRLVFSETTQIEFYTIPPKELYNYIDTYLPYDKAGAYGIQELPEYFVRKIRGSILNVIGFPMEKFYSLSPVEWKPLFKEKICESNSIN